MKLLVSLSNITRPDRETLKRYKEDLARLKPLFLNFSEGIKTALAKAGKTSGKALVAFSARGRITGHAEYSLSIDGLKGTVIVEAVLSGKTLKDSKLTVTALCDKKAIKKNLSIAFARSGTAMTATNISKALKALLSFAAKKKDRAPTSEEQLVLDAKERVKSKSTMASLINAAMPKGFSVKVVKYSHMGFPYSGIFVVGESTKVQNMAINLGNDGKFTISICPKGFGGSPYETWGDKKFGSKELSTANLQKALQKHGYL